MSIDWVTAHLPPWLLWSMHIRLSIVHVGHHHFSFFMGALHFLCYLHWTWNCYFLSEHIFTAVYKYISLVVHIKVKVDVPVYSLHLCKQTLPTVHISPRPCGLTQVSISFPWGQCTCFIEACSTMLQLAFTVQPSTIFYFIGMKSDQGHAAPFYCDISNRETNIPSPDSNCPSRSCAQESLILYQLSKPNPQ